MSKTVRSQYNNKEKRSNQDQLDKVCYNCGEEMHSRHSIMCVTCAESLEEYLDDETDIWAESPAKEGD